MLDARGEINCGRLDVRVPHHLREAVDIAAALKHERCKSMSKHMGVKINAGGVLQILNEIAQ